MTVIRIRRRIRKIEGRQMIRLTPLPIQQQQQQQQQRHQQHKQSHCSLKRFRGGEGGGGSCLFIVVSVGLVLLCITSSFIVSAEGPHCNQVGHGPEDMIMATGRINSKYSWYKRGHKTYVPVVMDPTYSHKEHSTIVGGLNEISEKTCVEFDFYDDEHSLHGKDYVYITRTTKRGCWSYIGRIGRGKQELGLPPGCITHRTAMHEMMHALGFRHEHVRHDRDDYIIIFWGNIRPGRESNFQKRSNEFSVGPYDYNSIMHYERKAFSLNKMDTIRPLKNGVKIGVRQKMSHWDAKKINIMYGCHAGGGGSGGHISWDAEHGDDDENEIVDPRLIDDSLSSHLTRNASSSPSSAEIEVAYDELDYDPGRSSGGSGSSPRGRSRSFHDDVHDYHGSEDDGGGGGGGTSLESFEGRHNNNDGYSTNRRDHGHPSRYSHNGHGHDNDHHHEEPNHQLDHHNTHNNNHDGFTHSPNNNAYPQSYSHFSLDTYPGGDGGGGGASDDNNSGGNDDFYDF